MTTPDPPTFDLTILAVVSHDGRPAVVLDRTARTAAGGLYNLWLEGGGWVHVSEVVLEDETTVTRMVEGDAPAELSAGELASWSGVYYSDPRDAGLEAVASPVETSLGPAPAWLIEPGGGSARWAIHIHGLGSPRVGTLRGVEVAASAGITSLVVSYRNDGEGPTVGSGRSTLGTTEVEDVRAAARYAIAKGARRIVLFGWSMGAAIALQLAAEAEFRGVVDGLVMESPVLDWQSTINANCARAGLPRWCGLLARPWLRLGVPSRLIGLVAPIPLERFDWLAHGDRLRLPALIVHGAHDSSTPYEISRRLANLRPDLVRLETFCADHTMCWNSDPGRWRAEVQDWLRSGASLLPGDA